MDGGIIVTSPHCTKGVNTRVLMHANTKDLKHSDGGNMDGENYIAQLTDEPETQTETDDE